MINTSTKKFGPIFTVRIRNPQEFMELCNKDYPIVGKLPIKWKASNKWDFDFIKKTVGHKDVLVSTTVEEHEETKRVVTNVSNYLQTIQSNSKVKTYMKEIPLKQLESSLLQDLEFEHYYPPSKYHTKEFIWIGNQNAVTGLHYDDEHNIIAQITGHKRFILYPYDQRENLYVNDKYDIGTECCDYDPEKQDYETYPLAKIADEFALSIDLEPGDLLYIPRYWWHHVHSLDCNITTNCFASTTMELILGETSRKFYDILHHYFGYKRRHCVCHNQNESLLNSNSKSAIYPPNSSYASWFNN